MHKRFGIVWLVLLFLAGTFSSTAISANELPFKLNARSAIVVDAETGEVLLNKRASDLRPIASITKLMTAVVVLDAKLPLDEEISISREEVEATMTSKGSRNISRSLPVGIVLTRAELLHLALMNSQNRAAAALARTYPGGTEAFVEAMNKKAKELGMSDTNYVDPTGLFNENVSSAHDLVTLVRYASSYDVINDFSTTTEFALTTYVQQRRTKNKRAQVREKKLKFRTTNRLVRIDSWNIVLQKTGFIKDAGHCLVMMAEIGVRNVIIVLLNTTNNTRRAADATNIKYYLETGNIPIVKEMQPKRKKVHTKKIAKQIVKPVETPVQATTPLPAPVEKPATPSVWERVLGITGRKP